MQRELASAQEEGAELKRSLEDASENYKRASDGLSDSQKAVSRLTSTLEGVSDARDQLEASLQSAKVQTGLRPRHHRNSCSAMSRVSIVSEGRMQFI